MGRKNWKWRVAPEPEGRYRAFDKRGWPRANYANGSPCAAIVSTIGEEYVPARVREQDHALLKVMIADWGYFNGEDQPLTFRWRVWKRLFNTVREAKEAVNTYLAGDITRQHPDYWRN